MKLDPENRECLEGAYRVSGALLLTLRASRDYGWGLEECITLAESLHDNLRSITQTDSAAA